MRLEGKVALISGGARGMGAAEARMFAGEGAKVVIGDVLEHEGSQTEAEINETGGQCLFVTRLDLPLYGLLWSASRTKNQSAPVGHHLDANACGEHPHGRARHYVRV